jgi:hypothetical protein
MNIGSIIITILGLCLFETVSSIDNAIINAEVLSTMSKRARKWFLFWGILFAVFVVRGLLPWAIVWVTTPQAGPLGALVSTFTSDHKTVEAIEASAPILLMGGGVFLVFLFLHWLFLDEKHFGLPGEKFIYSKGVWFHSIAAVVLAALIGTSLKHNPMMAFSAAVGASAFFISNGFKANAEIREKELLHSKMSDIAKILYLEVIDATFSIDGVLGAFAFTLVVPLIIAGNGLGAFVVRQITVGNIDRIKKYRYLKNGAMYSILGLGSIMIVDAFGVHIPEYISPVATFCIVAFFFMKSVLAIRKEDGAKKHSK